MARFLLREARFPDDLDAVVDLYLESARYHVGLAPDRYQLPDVAVLRRDLIDAAGQARLVVAEDTSSELVGFAAAFIRLAQIGGVIAEAGPVLRVTDICVTKASRRTGVGEALLAAIETWGATSGALCASLSVDAANTPALALYRKRGYSETMVEAWKPIGAT